MSARVLGLGRRSPAAAPTPSVRARCGRRRPPRHLRVARDIGEVHDGRVRQRGHAQEAAEGGDVPRGGFRNDFFPGGTFPRTRGDPLEGCRSSRSPEADRARRSQTPPASRSPRGHARRSRRGRRPEGRRPVDPRSGQLVRTARTWTTYLFLLRRIGFAPRRTGVLLLPGIGLAGRGSSSMMFECEKERVPDDTDVARRVRPCRQRPHQSQSWLRLSHLILLLEILPDRSGARRCRGNGRSPTSGSRSDHAVLRGFSGEAFQREPRSLRRDTHRCRC